MSDHLRLVTSDSRKIATVPAGRMMDLVDAAEAAYLKMKVEYDRGVMDAHREQPPLEECWAEGERLIDALNELKNAIMDDVLGPNGEKITSPSSKNVMEFLSMFATLMAGAKEELSDEDYGRLLKRAEIILGSWGRGS